MTKARRQLIDYNRSKSALLQQFPEALLTEKQQISIEEGTYDPKHNVTHDRYFKTQLLDYQNYPDDYFQRLAVWYMPLFGDNYTYIFKIIILLIN